MTGAATGVSKARSFSTAAWPCTARAGIKVAGGAFAGLGLVKLLAYGRANRAPAPGTLPDPPPPPGVRPDGTANSDLGVGLFGADGEPLTDANGKPVLVRFSDLVPQPPTVPPWEMHLPPDPTGSVRRLKRSWFGGALTEVVEAPLNAPQHYRLGDDGKVYCIEAPSEPGLSPLP